MTGMETLVKFSKELIAPCGINCGTCRAYLREKNKCHGCRHAELNTPKSRLTCRIKNCEDLQITESKLCHECPVFPCDTMKNIDKRYRTRYKTSLIRNLETIKEVGLKNFIETEVNRWTCPNCGSVLCVHTDFCLKCNLEFNKEAL
jgi:hypothetical protein